MRRKEFREKFARWCEETVFHSFCIAMMGHSLYRELTTYGDCAIPILIDELLIGKASINHFLLLDEYVGRNVCRPEHAGRIPDMASDWIEWYDSGGWQQTA